jgi:ParB family chromosome partitioning protein
MVEVGKRRVLGRGLDALLPPVPVSVAATPVGALADAAATRPRRGPELFLAPIESLHPNRAQPRQRFDDGSLDGLAASLKDMGMLEPILVRNRAQGGYEIVAGERRWRAAQRAGIHEVPVLVRELSEERAFEAALVENLVREDLNPLEAARAFQRLVDEHGHSVEEVSAMVGKDRSTVANALRILKLPESILDRIAARELSEGHARALLGAANPGSVETLAREAVDKGWSVRETERRARAVARETKKNGAAHKSANVRDVEEQLTRALGTPVTLADRKGKGHLAIRFASYDELDRLIQRFLG